MRSALVASIRSPESSSRIFDTPQSLWRAATLLAARAAPCRQECPGYFYASAGVSGRFLCSAKHLHRGALHSCISRIKISPLDVLTFIPDFSSLSRRSTVRRRKQLWPGKLRVHRNIAGNTRRDGCRASTRCTWEAIRVLRL